MVALPAPHAQRPIGRQLAESRLLEQRARGAQLANPKVRGFPRDDLDRGPVEVEVREDPVVVALRVDQQERHVTAAR